MTLLRVLLLLVALVRAAPAAPACCDETSSSDCCGPAGDCPATPDDHCVFTCTVTPIAPALSHAGDAPAMTDVLSPQALVMGSGPPHLLGADVGRTLPRYLLLGRQRN